jgi:hypothetical protein
VLKILARTPPLEEMRFAAKLGTAVGCLKSGIVKEAKLLRLVEGERVFQPRFHDHVIRHERALERVREYIVNNPRQWELDRENPQRSAEHEFYRWLEQYGAHLSRGKL